jgi:hypothetical protein
VTSIREQVRRYFKGLGDPEARQYSLRVHWINEVRHWDARKRQGVTERLAQALSVKEGIDRIQLDEIDDHPHTIDSLSILREVLHAFKDQDDGSQS